MRTLAIEINDAGLVVADEDAVLAVEPGYALVENGTITTGAAAQGQARLKPDRISNRYWSGLSLQPGSAGLGSMNAAELAFAQLDALWRRFRDDASGAVLVVPGYYSREQLGLLLGLAEECGLTVRGLVDTAVAASSRPYPGRQIVHVDAGLHRVSLTALTQADEAIAEQEQALETTGLVTVEERLARWVSEVFVLATRFDPLHRAETEQTLYDRLPQWLDALRDTDSLELTLPYGDEVFTVGVRREQLLGVLAGFNRAVVQLIAQAREPGTGLAVQLSERLAGLPGLGRELARLDDARVVRLPAGHAARAALRGLDVLAGGSVRLLRHMPWREAADETADAADAGAPAEDEPRPRSPAATHVVYRGVAYAVGPEGVAVGREKLDGRPSIVVDGEHGGLSRLHCELVVRDGELWLADRSRYGTFVNERRIADETALSPADVIRIGSPGAELQAIRVEDGDG